MTNRLRDQKSPYLLQHAQNPVDWYPWGPEAMQRAQEEDRPMLVSIGYSACHWCHVMAHESFEDDATARLMNELFVNVKVDREERPDVDAIYMEAVQALTQSGGWPLNVFVTPDGRPFYGGTYFPPEPRHGMPSWRQVIESVARAYRERRDHVLQNADTLTDYLRESQCRAASASLGPDILDQAYESASRQFDRHHGGFGGAPKFPQPLALQLILRLFRRFGDRKAIDFLQLTFRAMSEGGIFDHLGGGFHRYTVDGSWIIPHFEKMLYDNALLAHTYTFAWQATHDPLYQSTAERTLEYLLRDMRSPLGGFYSAEDADSEGEEGKFYLWTPAELESAAGADAEFAASRFGVRPAGNFEGRTILTVAASVEEIAGQFHVAPEEVVRRLEFARDSMFQARSKRVPPAKDTKIIASWNALAIGALAEAGRTFGRDDYVAAAETAAAFVLDEMVTSHGLVRTYADGPADVPGFLEDYAYLVEALLTLYEATFSPKYLRSAARLADDLLKRFRDPDSGILFDSQPENELIVRPRGLFDNPIPSGSSSASMALLRLAAFTGEGDYTRAAESALRAAADVLGRAPLAVPYLLCALDFKESTPVQIAIVGRDEAETREMVRQVYSTYLPNRALAVGETGETSLLQDRIRLNGRPTAYVCEHFSCRLPVTDLDSLTMQLSERATPER